MKEIILNNLTVIVGILTMIVNIFIARYNVGKNRKIYGVKTIAVLGVDEVNKELQNGEYTILHVEPTNQRGGIMYVLDKLRK